MSKLSAADLPPLLDILENPENPAFAQAVERLADLDPTTLTATNAAPLLARLQAILLKLAADTTLTAAQLNALRHGNKAVQSYGGK